MTVLPVIVRELRAQARQTFTYHLRVLGVAAVLAVCVFFALNWGLSPGQGAHLFANLHLALFVAIWILVPLSTADCLSRERREGTLGLLFLTPLRASDIVVAKGVVHGLRAFALWLAALPVLMIPFLLGGVSWEAAAMSLLVNFSSICWALAAALVASAGSRSWLRSLIGAVVLACAAFVAFVAFVFLTGLLGSLTTGLSRSQLPSGTEYMWFLGVNLVGNPATQNYLRPPVAGPPFSTGGSVFAVPMGSPLKSMALAIVISVVVLGGAVLVAAIIIQRTWREEPPPEWVLWLRTKLCTPVLWTSLLRRWMHWTLNRNPIGWLEQRTWRGRLVTWAWLAVMVSIYSAVLYDRNFDSHFRGIQLFMGWMLAGSIASSAAGSFRRERESGVLELLLVAPLSVGQIIGGRLRGLWGQFLPAIVLLLGIWLSFVGLLTEREELEAIWFFGITFLTLPVSGLYFSLRCRNFVSAFVSTLAVGVLAPLALPPLVGWVWWLGGGFGASNLWRAGLTVQSSVVQIIAAVLLGYRLRHRLQTRAFPLERTLT